MEKMGGTDRGETGESEIDMSLSVRDMDGGRGKFEPVLVVVVLWFAAKGAKGNDGTSCAEIAIRESERIFIQLHRPYLISKKKYTCALLDFPGNSVVLLLR